MTPRADQVSVVVQGPVQAHLPGVLESVRRHLPGAELVLSTWRGSGAAAYDADVTVESEDPGSVGYWEGNTRPINTNRLLRSSRAGVLRATRPFVLKLRSDSPLTGAGFLDWWGARPTRVPPLAVFRERVLTLSVATRPSSLGAYLFHPSDCVHFGLAADVRHLWDAPEVDEAANTAYWTAQGAGGSGRHAPPVGLWNEQLVWLSALARAGHEVAYPYFRYTRPGLAALSDLSLVNNFLVLEDWQFGVSLAKLAPLVRSCSPDGYLAHEDWASLYAQLERLDGARSGLKDAA